MKKNGLVLAAILLASAGFVGDARAVVTHEPIIGGKIVGFARVGGTTFGYMPEYIFTNPNCTATLNVSRISILDENGALVADLTPSSPPSDYVIGNLAPHKVGFVILGKVLSELGLGIPSYPQVYTVEISYTSRGKFLPLQGMVNEYEYAADGQKYKISNNMVNY